MRRLTGHGTPREAAAALHAAVGIVLLTDDALVLLADADADADDDAQGAVLIACG